jgi:hypothetical protein
MRLQTRMTQTATEPSSVKQSRSRLGAAAYPIKAIITLIGLDGKPVGITTSSETKEGLGWTPGLAVLSAAGVLVGAIAANSARSGANWSVGLFYLSIAFIILPVSARLAYPDLSRHERIALVLTAAAALFALRVIRAPVAFVDHDEFLHWRTANDILEQGALFTANALLPVSPKFPGLEIVTTAIVQLTGLPVFGSALVLLATCRMLFMAALFLVFEKISASAQVSSLACILFMGSSTFLVFDSHFSYESLAVVFLVLALLSDVCADQSPSRRWVLSATLTAPFLAALAVTHHMTSFVAAALFLGLAFLELIKTPRKLGNALGISVVALIMPLAWSQLMGNPTGGYLGPVIMDGLYEASHLLSPSSSGRELFVSEDGAVAPLWQRSAMIASVFLICAGLVPGFFRSMAHAGLEVVAMRKSIRSLGKSTNSRLILLTLLTLVFPLSILFRLTRSGWEIGNRIGPFSFLGVSLVIAIGTVAFWLRTPKGVSGPILFGAAAATIVIGGVISSEGPRILVPANYHVSADSASIEPMGIAAAEWSRRWLGPENLFASDRINRLLLATYGRQQVATTLRDPRDTSVAIQSPTLGPAEIEILRQTGVDYVLTDLRLTTGLPVVGVYFDGGAGDRSHATPLASSALLKFNAESRISRPFDNGYQIVFDVRNLHAKR